MNVETHHLLVYAEHVNTLHENKCHTESRSSVRASSKVGLEATRKNYAHGSVPSPKGKGKGKAVPVLFLTENHAMKAHWGSGCIAPLHSLTSALDGCESRRQNAGRNHNLHIVNKSF
jgi:hypothetical protein